MTRSGPPIANRPRGALARAFLGDRRATSILEFGFVAPILILVVLGTIDLGRALWTSTTLAQTASEASRYAAIRGAEKIDPATSEEVEAFARNRAVGLNPDVLAVTVAWNPDNTAGSQVTVQVTYPFEFFMVGFLPIDPIELERQSTMVVN